MGKRLHLETQLGHRITRITSGGAYIAGVIVKAGRSNAIQEQGAASKIRGAPGERRDLT
jgi:hypothetical protein